MENTNHSDSFLFLNINSANHYDNKSLFHNDQLSFNYKNLPLVERLAIYITFVVSTIGIIGNACTIIVLNQQTMRKWRSSILLSALAVADLLYLLIIFLSIIDTLTYQAIGFHRSLLLCLTTVYITHVCSFLSATFTLSFTLQRFVAVFFPLHANTIISRRSSVINILLLIFISCTFYSFSFFLTNISHGQCREDENYPALFPLLIVDICLTFVLPFIFILLFNCAIVYKLQERKKFTKKFGKIIIRFCHFFDLFSKLYVYMFNLKIRIRTK
jgi:7 transmembrane receptor (rhodopsin family)